MRVSALPLIVITLAASSVLPQRSHSGYNAGTPIPRVLVNDRSISLQESLYPGYYTNRSAVRDMGWVLRHDSVLVAFWRESGAHTLEVLAGLSGIPWVEEDFDIHLVRYYPTAGSAAPLIIPAGGIRRGALTEAAPSGVSMKLNLIYQLAHRNLAQATPPLDTLNPAIARHPLMQPGPYRRDNLAMLLALVACQKVIGLDSAYEAHESAFWKQRTPGRRILQDYLLSEWILSPEHPLARWIVEEPQSSELVSITRSPRITRRTGPTQRGLYVEGLPLKGELGFSAKTDGANRLVIDKIDVFRLAYACGLREGDVIQHVNGRRPRNHKDLIEKVVAAVDDNGATLRVVRGGRTETVIIQRLELPPMDDPFYWDIFDDSLFFEEPTPADSIGRQESDSSR